MVSLCLSCLCRTQEWLWHQQGSAASACSSKDQDCSVYGHLEKQLLPKFPVCLFPMFTDGWVFVCFFEVMVVDFTRLYLVIINSIIIATWMSRIPVRWLSDLGLSCSWFFEISSSWISSVAPGWARKGLIMGGFIPHHLLWNDQCLKWLGLHRVPLDKLSYSNRGSCLVIQIFQWEFLFTSCTLWMWQEGLHLSKRKDGIKWSGSCYLAFGSEQLGLIPLSANLLVARHLIIKCHCERENKGCEHFSSFQSCELWTAGLPCWLSFVWEICKTAWGSRPPVRELSRVLLEEYGA